MSFTTGRLENVKPYNYTYADAAARTGATGFVTADLGKVALQLDTATLWMLTDDSPVTWREILTGTAGGSVATDAIWDAAGDLAVGSGANTAAKLTMGSALQNLRVNAGATGLEWAAPAGGGGGQELGYAELSADFSTASTSLVDVTGFAVTVTIGSRPVRIDVFVPRMDETASNAQAVLEIYDNTAGARVKAGAVWMHADGNGSGGVLVSARHAPAAGSRTYKVRMSVSAGTGGLHNITGSPAHLLVTEI